MRCTIAEHQIADDGKSCVCEYLVSRNQFIDGLIEWAKTAPYVPRNNFVSSKPEHKDFAKKNIVGTDLFDHLMELKNG